MTRPVTTAPGSAGSSASRKATGFAVAVMCLILVARVANVVWIGQARQVPFTVALFVVPLAYAVLGPRRLLDRYRWAVLAVQGVLTWVPLAIFGARWQIGIGGLLAGLVLLTARGRRAWLLAGLLLAAEVSARALVVGPPATPRWAGMLSAATYYIDDALSLFGLVRLAQVIGEVEEARRQAAGLAVARERLQAARSLQAAVGQRLADVAAKAAAARQALYQDAAQARAQIAAAGVAAREAVTQARVTATGHSVAGHDPASPAGPVIGARLAWTVLITVLLSYTATSVAWVVAYRYGPLLMALALGIIVLSLALQFYHSEVSGNGLRPTSWPVTLAAQAVLAFAFLLPFVHAYVGAMSIFLAGSVLLLVPGPLRWALYAVAVASYSVLGIVVPLRPQTIPESQWVSGIAYTAAVTAGVSLMVYGLTRLAWMATQLQALRGEVTRLAAVSERLRMARDVHDLLGLGLSAAALKADLIGALIGTDDARAAAEIAEMSRVCAAARADIRLITGNGAQLSLAGEMTAAEQILASAGIRVRAELPPGGLPIAADEVMAPVLREAVTNILRHAAATACTIEVTVRDGAMRLYVCNDGVTPGGAPQAAGTGRGLANLDARMQAAGGRLASRQAGDQFELTAQIPLAGTGFSRARLENPRLPRLPALHPAHEPSIDDALSPDHGADRSDEHPGWDVLEQIAGHPGAQGGL